MAVVDTLVQLAPELSSVDSEILDLYVTIATGQVGSVFGDQRDYAIAFLAAHMLTMRARSGAGGVIASESEGNLSRSYAVGANVGEYNATSYGQEFLRIRRMTVMGAMLAL